MAGMSFQARAGPTLGGTAGMLTGESYSISFEGATRIHAIATCVTSWNRNANVRGYATLVTRLYSRMKSCPSTATRWYYIAALARIGISTTPRLTLYASQLSDIIDQFEILNELDTAGIEPTGHAGDLQRRDARRRGRQTPCPPPTPLLSNAPRRDGRVLPRQGGAGRVTGCNVLAANSVNP